MYVERYGHGPSHCLGIHGWSGDHRTFEPLLEDLPEDVTFWSIDLPGCGKSPAPGSWTLSSICSELAAIANSLPSPLHVVGNCSGALLALMVAGRVPFARISMIDAFASWPWYFRIFLAPGWGRYAYMTAFANPIGRWLANASLKKRRTANTDLTSGFSRVDHDVTYQYLSMFRKIQSAEQFRGIACPMDIFYGEHSFIAVRQSAQHWKRIFPQARTVALKGAGHLPILEATVQLRSLLFEEKSCLAPPTNFAY